VRKEGKSSSIGGLFSELLKKKEIPNARKGSIGGGIIVTLCSFGGRGPGMMPHIPDLIAQKGESEVATNK